MKDDKSASKENVVTLNWIKIGLFWGLFMYIFTVVLLPLILREEITTRKMLINIPIWVIAGLIFGYWTNYLAVKRKKEADESEIDKTETNNTNN